MRLAVLGILASTVLAQQPAIENARVETRVFSGSVASMLRQFGAGPYWVGYREAAAKPWRGDNCEGGVSVMHLEGQSAFVVLVRVEGGRTDKLRPVSPDCRLDAGGLTFYWIDGVPAAASIAWLKTQVDAEHPGRALSVIALHGAPQANAVMIDMARNDRNPKIRSQALFWLAERAGDKEAAEVIHNAVLNDPDHSVKEQAVFALGQLPPDRGIPLPIELAKSNSDPNVWKRAMFWLGQSKDPRALDFIAGVLQK